MDQLSILERIDRLQHKLTCHLTVRHHRTGVAALDHHRVQIDGLRNRHLLDGDRSLECDSLHDLLTVEEFLSVELVVRLGVFEDLEVFQCLFEFTCSEEIGRSDKLKITCLCNQFIESAC